MTATNALAADALDRLASVRQTEESWAVVRGWTDGVWRGDTCGCSDDRCIGYHHSANEECGCLDTQIQRWINDEDADRCAADVWFFYQYALLPGQFRDDPDGAAAALSEAEAEAQAWVLEFHPHATSWTLHEEVNGRVGIAIATTYNPQLHLAWQAPISAPEHPTLPVSPSWIRSLATGEATA